MISLTPHLAERKAAGKKSLVGYVTAGLRDDWLDVTKALVDGGVDAIEVGIPFSDPVMDGAVIQEASNVALARGTTPSTVLGDLTGFDPGAPLAVMTYFNLIHRFGLREFATACSTAGITGAILPDLSLDAAGEWRTVAGAAGVATVFLVAPNTSDERLKTVCEASQGFVYAVGTLGVTGARDRLAPSAPVIGDRARSVTDKPVLIGVGVSSPEQAGQAAGHCDGVIVGSAIVKAMASGASPAQMASLAAEFRSAID